LYSKRREKIAESVIGRKMKRDFWGRLYGHLVYKQHRDELSEEEVYEIQTHLLEQGLYTQAEKSPSHYYIRVVDSEKKKTKPRIGLHIFLLLLTVLTTMLTGSNLLMRDPLASWADFWIGGRYAFALLAILFTHEMGHYLYARYYKIDVTLPYFIPFYIPFAFHPGTLGAFIRLRAPIPNKKALFDVGIAGPLAGFVMSIAFLVIGFNNVPPEEQMWQYISTLHPLDYDNTITLTLGGNLLYDFIANAMGKSYPPMYEMYHFPYIFAGWFGLLVTAINLMPIGQLDGGHITYAMFGPNAGRIALLAFGGLILLNIYLISQFSSFGYVLWTILILVFIRFKHPPTLDDDISIGPGRRALGILSYAIFVVCFSPLPFYLQ